MSLEIVSNVRAKYPTPLGATHPQFLLEVAAALKLGLLKKSGGTRIILPDGQGVSQDCVMKPNGIHWDILTDGEGDAIPRFDLLTNDDGSPFLTDPANFYPVAPQPTPAPVPTPTPEPTPGPAPTPPWVAALLEGFEALRLDVAVLTGHQENIDVELNNLRASVDLGFSEILTAVDEIEPLLKNPPTYRGKVFGVGVTLNPDKRG